MKRKGCGNSLEALHVLLIADRPLTVKEIQERMRQPLDRKQIYCLMDKLEIFGFRTTIIRSRWGNQYKVEI